MCKKTNYKCTTQKGKSLNVASVKAFLNIYTLHTSLSLVFTNTEISPEDMEARRRYRNTLHIQTTNKNRDSSAMYGLHKGPSLIDGSAVAASFKKRKKKLHLCCQTDDGVFLICLFCLFTQVVVC